MGKTIAVVEDSALVRHAVDESLRAFITKQFNRFAQISTELYPLITAIETFVQGGKRLRPLFAYWGLRAAGCQPAVSPDNPHIRAVAALEWLHACALIHDDVMDSSDTRRGKPAMHRLFAQYHQAAGWRGDADDYGVSSAILLGDLCLVWSDEMLHTAGIHPEPLIHARKYFDQMRAELMAGQYLDIISNTITDESRDRATTVMRYKSAKYTVEYPLLIGAALGGTTDEQLMKNLSNYGLPVGEAFQLRDDLLGVFGDPVITGKPAGDDLREGKRTLLIALALEQATKADAAYLRENLGNSRLTASAIDKIRHILISSGAADAVEVRIKELTAQSMVSASDLPEPAASALQALADFATTRTN